MRGTGIPSERSPRCWGVGGETEASCWPGHVQQGAAPETSFLPGVGGRCFCFRSLALSVLPGRASAMESHQPQGPVFFWARSGELGDKPRARSMRPETAVTATVEPLRGRGGQEGGLPKEGTSSFRWHPKVERGMARGGGNSIPGRRNSRHKGHITGSNFLCSKNRQKTSVAGV